MESILNGTIVYLALTGISAGMYTVSIKVMQEFMMQATGTESDVAVNLTPVLIVAVFTPLKNWVQGTVDQRFSSPARPPIPCASSTARSKACLISSTRCESPTG